MQGLSVAAKPWLQNLIMSSTKSNIGVSMSELHAVNTSYFTSHLISLAWISYLVMSLVVVQQPWLSEWRMLLSFMFYCKPVSWQLRCSNVLLELRLISVAVLNVVTSLAGRLVANQFFVDGLPECWEKVELLAMLFVNYFCCLLHNYRRSVIQCS